MSDEAVARIERSSVLRFASELVAWVATPWALAAHSPVLAGAALLLLIGLPAVFATPGDKTQVPVAVPGWVTIALVVLQLFAAVAASWAAWPVPAALLVWALVIATVHAEIPRWRRLADGDLVAPGPVYMANEVLAFVFELLALAILAWWGATVGSGLVLHLILGIGTPLAAAVVWGLFASPKAKVALPFPAVLAVKALVFGTAMICLDVLGHRTLAVLFGLLVTANTAIAALGRSESAD